MKKEKCYSCSKKNYEKQDWREELSKETIYVFRNAIISYGRNQGFKSPIENADKAIEKYITFIQSLINKQKEEVINYYQSEESD